MEQKNAARERLAQLEYRYFKGVSLKEAALLKTEEERRPFVLAQVERLLKEKMYDDDEAPLAEYLADELWFINEGREIAIPYELLLPKWAMEVYTDEENARMALILDISALCHDLDYHYVFDQHEAFGIKGQFWVSNKELVEWLKTTPYEHIAMHTAYIMKRYAIHVFRDMNYLAAQDETARIFSDKHNKLIRTPKETEIPPRDYVSCILDELIRIERHWMRGRRLKLDPEVVLLHDEIWGLVPSRFDKDVLEVARQLYDYMNKDVRGRLCRKGYSATQLDELPEEVRRKIADTADAFVDKVHELRDRYLAKGWLPDQSLEFNYLVAHAERIGGYWDSDEDCAL
jgi:hypothetical protein